MQVFRDTMKKLSVLLVLASISYSNALLYYVSSDPVENGTCTANGSIALTPCYSFDDLFNNETLLSHKTVPVKIFLLSAKYTPLQNFTAHNVGQLEILSWNQQGLLLTANCQ